MLEGFRADPDRVVVRDASRGLTGGDFAGTIDGYAWALAARGLGAGDRVALLATESPEALAVRYAVALVGAASVFTPDTGRPEQLVRFLKQIRPRLLVVFPETAPDAQAAAARILSDETVSVGPVDGLADLAEEAAAQDDMPFVGRAQPDDLAVLIASGGTTGGSKPACAPSTHTPPCSATSENRTENCWCAALLPTFHRFSSRRRSSEVGR
jgi:acyl-CoA synthetase (AMP-forming)/AMP-acid ligase II